MYIYNYNYNYIYNYNNYNVCNYTIDAIFSSPGNSDNTIQHKQEKEKRAKGNPTEEPGTVYFTLHQMLNLKLLYMHEQFIMFYIS